MSITAARKRLGVSQINGKVKKLTLCLDDTYDCPEMDAHGEPLTCSTRSSKHKEFANWSWIKACKFCMHRSVCDLDAAYVWAFRYKTQKGVSDVNNVIPWYERKIDWHVYNLIFMQSWFQHLQHHLYHLPTCYNKRKANILAGPPPPITRLVPIFSFLAYFWEYHGIMDPCGHHFCHGGTCKDVDVWTCQLVMTCSQHAAVSLYRYEFLRLIAILLIG